MAKLAGDHRSVASWKPQRTLIDGTWFNANYWYRVCLARAAMATVDGEEFGLLGAHSAGRSRETFARLGIKNVRTLADAAKQVKIEAIEFAGRLITTTKIANDILNWQMPNGLPASFVYDHILKRQRIAEVNVADPAFGDYVLAACTECLAAERLLDEIKPDLVLLSHSIGMPYAALGWSAVQRGIRTVVLFGNYGVPRPFKLSEPADFFDWNSGFTAAEIDALGRETRAQLVAVGKSYVQRRLAGLTDDLGGSLAFSATGRLDRDALCRRYGWSPDVPIVVVYASNWFDYPHSFGLVRFSNFLDWALATLAVASKTTSVNWLFKPHPCDVWYGGVTLSDLMPTQTPKHIALLPIDGSGADIMKAVDALVCVHSTAGLEYASQGKPVLVADSGWYDRAGFAMTVSSRHDYLAALQRRWWLDVDLDVAKERALAFAGSYFCAPAWQDALLTTDDSVQDGAWGRIESMLGRKTELRTEIETMRLWFGSDARRYHLFKMTRADRFSIANAA
ncbi:MAG: hypothetical protein PSV22_11735 [Pseudolabrys sp.]|nr:hypothetical protein [Pseudolabrys sp.]